MKEEEITFEALEKTIRDLKGKIKVISVMVEDLERKIKEIRSTHED